MFLKRAHIFALLIVLVVFTSCTKQEDVSQMPEEELVTRAREIHEKVLTIDTHIDIEVTFFTPEFFQGGQHEKLVSFSGMEEGGLDGAVFAVFNPPGPRTSQGYEEAYKIALEKFETIHRVVETEMPEKLGIADNSEEVNRVHDQGKKIVIIGVENGFAIGENLDNVKKFYDLGARYITLCHFGHNQICDSSMPGEGPESEHNGISEFGKKVITELNRLGIMVDVSHVSKKSMLDAVKLSKTPIIASHSSCSALCDVPRNLDDEQLLALKENGGVINMVGIAPYIKEDPPAKQEAINSLRKELGFPLDFGLFVQALKDASPERLNAYESRLDVINEKYPMANVRDFVDHIDHAVRLIGVEHVGISSDFYKGNMCLEGWENADQVFNVTLELVRRGYTEEEIGKIWSGNLLRVWRETETFAATL